MSRIILTILVGAAPFAASAATVQITVPGNANPYLAGMPDGTTASSGDVAPDESPVLVEGLSLGGGSRLGIAATGQVSLGQGLGPDPDGGGPITHSPGAQNGISAARMPRVSLLGVFLGDERPDLSPPPEGLDFSSDGSLQFTDLSPLLKQVFFIGDGVNDAGVAQAFTAPEGATRLYLGAMDGFGWYNNSGEFNVTITDGVIEEPSQVPLPAGLPLLASGVALVGLTARRRRKT